MPFFSSLQKTAPEFDRSLPWPLAGMVYVAMFIGPVSGGLFGGFFAPHLGSVAVGLLVGVGLTILNAWCNDRFVDPWIGRNQKLLQPIIVRILINVAGFVWAELLAAVSMFAPFVVFGVPLSPYFG